MSNVYSFLNSLSRCEIKSFRSAEKTIKNLSNCDSAILYNNVCLTEGILPKYTNFRAPNSRIDNSRITVTFRKNIVKEELMEKKKLRIELKEKLEKAKLDFLSCCGTGVVDRFFEILKEIEKEQDRYNRRRIENKLNGLYRGHLILPEAKKTYYNLTDVKLTKYQKEVLNLGLNYHLPSKFDPFIKKAQIENLYCQLKDIENKQEILMYNDIEAALVSEAHKNRAPRERSIFSREQKEAIAELRNNNEIVLRKSDKSNNYVPNNR